MTRHEGGDDRLALQAIRELRGLIAVGLRGIETTELEARITELEYHHTLQRPRSYDFAQPTGPN